MADRPTCDAGLAHAHSQLLGERLGGSFFAGGGGGDGPQGPTGFGGLLPSSGHQHLNKVNEYGSLDDNGTWYEDKQPCLQRWRAGGIGTMLPAGVQLEHKPLNVSLPPLPPTQQQQQQQGGMPPPPAVQQQQASQPVHGWLNLEAGRQQQPATAQHQQRPPKAAGRAPSPALPAALAAAGPRGGLQPQPQLQAAAMPVPGNPLKFRLKFVNRGGSREGSAERRTTSPPEAASIPAAAAAAAAPQRNQQDELLQTVRQLGANPLLSPLPTDWADVLRRQPEQQHAAVQVAAANPVQRAATPPAAAQQAQRAVTPPAAKQAQRAATPPAAAKQEAVAAAMPAAAAKQEQSAPLPLALAGRAVSLPLASKGAAAAPSPFLDAATTSQEVFEDRERQQGAVQQQREQAQGRSTSPSADGAWQQQQAPKHRRSPSAPAAAAGPGSKRPAEQPAAARAASPPGAAAATAGAPPPLKRQRSLEAARAATAAAAPAAAVQQPPLKRHGSGSYAAAAATYGSPSAFNDCGTPLHMQGSPGTASAAAPHGGSSNSHPLHGGHSSNMAAAAAAPPMAAGLRQQQAPPAQLQQQRQATPPPAPQPQQQPVAAKQQQPQPAVPVWAAEAVANRGDSSSLGVVASLLPDALQPAHGASALPASNMVHSLQEEGKKLKKFAEKKMKDGRPTHVSSMFLCQSCVKFLTVAATMEAHPAKFSRESTSSMFSQTASLLDSCAHNASRAGGPAMITQAISLLAQRLAAVARLRAVYCLRTEGLQQVAAFRSALEKASGETYQRPSPTDSNTSTSISVPLDGTGKQAGGVAAGTPAGPLPLGSSARRPQPPAGRGGMPSGGATGSSPAAVTQQQASVAAAPLVGMPKPVLERQLAAAQHSQSLLEALSSFAKSGERLRDYMCQAAAQNSVHGLKVAAATLLLSADAGMGPAGGILAFAKDALDAVMQMS